MYSFIASKLFIILVCVLSIRCDLELETSLNNDDKSDPNEPFLDKLFGSLTSSTSDPNISSNKADIKEVADIHIETSATTITTITTGTSTTTTTSTANSTTSDATISSTIAPITSEISTDIPIISNNQSQQCVKIGLNAKILLKYKSNESISQEIQLSGGNINGELVQPDKCSDKQKIVINYEQIQKSQLVLW